jgi:hypothetical protein
MAIIETPPRPAQRKRGSPEGRIQSSCVAWFWNTYPQYRELYFCVPNENAREDSNASTGAIRRSMGVVKGVSDTILFLARGKYHALCVEFKTDVGRQSDAQRLWQSKVEAQGYRYEVVRSLEEFKKLIVEYLNS